MLLSSHALTELEERAGRVIIMNRGVKVADGTLDELRRIARLPTRIRLKVADAGLASVPNWLGTVGEWRQINGHMIEIDATPDRKIEVLRRATGEGAPGRGCRRRPAHPRRALRPLSRSQEAAR